MLKKHSLSIAGHTTSLTLEEPFWDELEKIARERKTSRSALIAEIDKNRRGNLSSAVRVFVVQELQTKILARASLAPPLAVAKTDYLDIQGLPLRKPQVE